MCCAVDDACGPWQVVQTRRRRGADQTGNCSSDGTLAGNSERGALLAPEPHEAEPVLTLKPAPRAAAAVSAAAAPAAREWAEPAQLSVVQQAACSGSAASDMMPTGTLGADRAACPERESASCEYASCASSPETAGAVHLRASQAAPTASSDAQCSSWPAVLPVWSSSPRSLPSAFHQGASASALPWFGGAAASMWAYNRSEAATQTDPVEIAALHHDKAPTPSASVALSVQLMWAELERTGLASLCASCRPPA